MEATNLSQGGGALLAYALSRLRPEIFTHPVWVSFGKKEKPVSPEVFDSLSIAAKQLQDKDPDSACQVLLVCAVLQNDTGHQEDALTSIQQVLSIAVRSGLDQEIIWARWGACAICVQAGDYEQAATHLHCLEDTLREQGDWILADYIEMVRDFLLQKSLASAPGGPDLSGDQPPEGLMRLTWEWFSQWGLPAKAGIADFQQTTSLSIPPTTQMAVSSQPFFSRQRWQGYWRTFRQVATGEMRLKWVAQDTVPHVATSPPHPSQPAPQIPAWRKLVAPPPPAETSSHTSLLVYCLGPFRIYINEQTIENWPGHKCMQILKYLVIHRSTPVNQEILMELFWPEMDPKSARRNLYQAIYNLRQALQNNGEDYPYVLTEGNHYRLNPDLDIWVDSEAFYLCYQNAQNLAGSGNQDESVREFQRAEEIYQGEFLAEDRYEDWPLVHREKLKNAYLDALDQLSQHFYTIEQFSTCIYYCHKILEEDNCREDIHRRVMMCYMNMDQPNLALRQYHLCVDALRKELDVLPMPSTVELYKQIQSRRGK